MILMKLNKVLGVCDIEGYSGNKEKVGGWFPVESVSFGFNPQANQSTPTGATPSGSTRNAQTGARNAQPAATPGANQGSDNTSTFTAMNVSKSVDMSSINLMKLAMECRGRPGAQDQVKQQALTADIHFVGSLGIPGRDSYIFTFLRIHLDTVTIEDWQINASGENRPQENFKLAYEKAAVCYSKTKDGSDITKVQFGWDQKENQEWHVVTDDFPDGPADN